MFYFKGCQKCKGDLHLEDDLYGAFYKCMQCGRITEVRLREPGMVITAPDRTEPGRTEPGRTEPGRTDRVAA